VIGKTVDFRPDGGSARFFNSDPPRKIFPAYFPKREPIDPADKRSPVVPIFQEQGQAGRVGDGEPETRA